MRVFVTGASGFIGSAVVPELIAAGHQVVGLARSQGSADALSAAGAGVQRGTLDDLDALHAAASASDGVIHLAFKHDQAFGGSFDAAAASDVRAIETLGAALEGSDRPLVIAAGTGALPPGRVGTERDTHDPDHPLRARAAGERAALALAEHGVRASSLRLPPTVHGAGDQGFIAAVVGVARAKGVAGHIGDGANRWAAVHRLDAARLFRLAMEAAPAGSILHGVAEEGVSMRAIAEAIGRQLGLPVVSIAPAEADTHFGWLAMLLAADVPASSALTRELMGWQPTGPGLLDDLNAGYYVQPPAAVPAA